MKNLEQEKKIFLMFMILLLTTWFATADGETIVVDENDDARKFFLQTYVNTDLTEVVGLVFSHTYSLSICIFVSR